MGVLKEAKKIEQDIIVANHFNISSGLLDEYKFKEIEIEDERSKWQLKNQN